MYDLQIDPHQKVSLAPSSEPRNPAHHLNRHRKAFFCISTLAKPAISVIWMKSCSSQIAKRHQMDPAQPDPPACPPDWACSCGQIHRAMALRIIPFFKLACMDCSGWINACCSHLRIGISKSRSVPSYVQSKRQLALALNAAVLLSNTK